MLARPTTYDPAQGPAEITPPTGSFEGFEANNREPAAVAPFLATPGPFVSEITKEEKDASAPSQAPDKLQRRGDILDIALGIAMLIEDLFPGISFPDKSDDP